MEQIMERILAHMMETRPRSQVVYRPYYARDGIRQKAVLKGWEIDPKKLWPDGKKGQQGFLKAYVQAQKAEKALLNLKGSHAAVFYHDKRIQPQCEDERGSCYEIRVSAEPKELVIQCDLGESSRRLEMVISTVYYRGMDAKDYLNHIRLINPCKAPAMEGLAAAGPYPEGTHYRDARWELPHEPCGEAASRVVDFGKWYGKERGRVAYAVSSCRKAGRIRVSCLSESRIFVNGIGTDSSQGSLQKTETGFKELLLKEGDVLLIKSLKSCDGWGFCCEDENDVLELPMVKVKERFFGKFLLVGAFGTEADIRSENRNMDVAFGPERRLQWKIPYFNGEGQRCFWRFNLEGIYLRPYLDTSFFGQWFYALMVGNYGVLRASEYLEKKELTDYFLENMQLLADYYEYMKFDAALFGEPAFLQRAILPDNLDAIGAMGMCLAEGYKRTLDGRILSVLLSLAAAAGKQIPRFEDGTYCREDTMWADDTFMSIPFLVRMWEITGEEEYLSECFCQLTGFRKRLYMEEKGLFSHIYFPERREANRIPWGRGNGWVFLTLADFLRKLSVHGMAHKMKEKAEEWILFFREFAAGVAGCQDEEGMWHQILDEETSYQETSCTGMFVAGLSYGITCGFLDPVYIHSARKGMEALLSKAVTKEGVVKGVCRGSGCSMERSYYRKLGTVDDDDHGTGIILLAMTALQEAEAMQETEAMQKEVI